MYPPRDMDATLIDETKNDETPLEIAPVSVCVSSIRLLQSPFEYFSAFGTLNNENSKWYVSVDISALLDDSSVLIEGVLFRACYLGSTQLVCEGEPTKSTRMCQAEEAVSRIKVRLSLSYSMFAFYTYPLLPTFYLIVLLLKILFFVIIP